MTSIALVHDYLTQRGGAERVVLSMIKAFPEAPLFTSLFWPEGTFPEFHHANLRVLGLNRFSVLRRHHRLAAPFLAQAFSRVSVDADVVLCSSSGWAHGVQTAGRKIVYCHTPARWLYQGDRYFGCHRPPARVVLKAVRPMLLQWDYRAAHTAHRYITQSTAVQQRIRTIYSIEADVLPAPIALGLGEGEPIEGIESGFFLCVSRLLPYKNVDAVLGAFAQLPNQRLVLVGAGPEARRLRHRAPKNVQLLGTVSDQQLRWLYRSCYGLIAASFEDYGLTPLEAAAHGKPTAALRWGGYLDTVREGETGIFFAEPSADAIREAVNRLATYPFSSTAIRAHAMIYSEDAFIRRLRAIVNGDRTPDQRILAKVS